MDEEARELLGGATEAKTLSATEPLRVHVGAHDAVVWKLSRRHIEPLRAATPKPTPKAAKHDKAPKAKKETKAPAPEKSYKKNKKQS